MIWPALKALLWRDIILARKQGGGLGAALGFILAVIVLVPIAIGPDPIMLRGPLRLAHRALHNPPKKQRLQLLQ